MNSPANQQHSASGDGEEETYASSEASLPTARFTKEVSTSAGKSKYAEKPKAIKGKQNRKYTYITEASGMNINDKGKASKEMEPKKYALVGMTAKLTARFTLSKSFSLFGIFILLKIRFVIGVKRRMPSTAA